MYYFDSEYLGQYLDQGVDLKVFVDKEYITIADRSDLESETYGVGYDLNGKPHTFDYREVELIKAGGGIVTIEQLQDIVDGQANDTESDSEMTSGDAEPPMGETPPDMEKAPEDDAAPPEEEENEPEPPRESIYYQKMVVGMLNEKKNKKVIAHNGLSIGDFVQNVDLRCDFHGSRGTVTDIILPDKHGGMTEVEYRIFNFGFNFKPGQKVTKPLNMLQRIGNDE